MSKKIWIFGDSFSTPFEKQEIGAWATPYIEWKGYRPKTFGEIIGEELELEVIHLAVGGSDNDTIFETILKHAPSIKKEDIVIIGWSSVERFRVGNLENRFVTIIPNFRLHHTLSFLSESTIDEMLVNRTLPTYKEELYQRIIFLNWLFRDMKLIQWTPFLYDKIRIYGFTSDTVSTILKETKGEIWDGHYSEPGHRYIADNFLSLLNDDKMRRWINTMCERVKFV